MVCGPPGVWGPQIENDCCIPLSVIFGLHGLRQTPHSLHFYTIPRYIGVLLENNTQAHRNPAFF